MPQYSHITSRCFVNAPFERLRTGLLELFIKHRLQPEIGLEGDTLYDTTREEFAEIANALKKNNLACTMHAPFLDLVPGASDRNILKASRDKLEKAFQLIPLFAPQSIVCHLGYEELKHSMQKEKWLKNSLATWWPLMERAKRYQTTIMLENTFEPSPEPLLNVLTALNSNSARLCLDVGHIQAFSKSSWQVWLPVLFPFLGQLHLHDNLGDLDAHLAIGKGTIDFAGLFTYLSGKDLYPILTLEPHEENGLWDSLAALDRMHIFDSQVPA
ncbi:MAG: hypothetical protein A2511_02630 [Deltaproteobacteria bacterium RIFOXYD12_FULL_50_9]|nr:MAG: hypothetical protein A2511_02630 [Deltaproteobacteria bacterium RIFOXYD12_FULL_50_9]